MRWLVIAMCLVCVESCWFVSKERTLEKIIKVLEPRTYVDRPYIEDMCKKMPAPFAWAVHKIGIEAALEDCDENKDEKITLAEMKSMDTCLTNCAKLSIINMVL